MIALSKISGIYKIQSKIKPERIYIGSAVNLQKRKRRTEMVKKWWESRRVV
jgi:hypothetical protein